MNRLSNLPPGVTDRMIEEQQETLDEYGFPEDSEDKPESEDYVITPCGLLGGRTALSQVEGKFLGEFRTDEEAIAFARARMEKEQFWPNIWSVSDHGNWELIPADLLRKP